jgi:CHAT domain-containing protein/tetratricopeptide (TPR) repeat protein
MKRALLTAACLASIAAGPRPAPAAMAPEALPEGLVVESVQRIDAPKGFREGDVLLSWRRAASPPASPEAGGSFASPWDLVEIQVEQEMRGTVTITGGRGGQPMTWVVPTGTWSLRASPRFSGPVAVAYAEGQRRIAAGELDGGVAQLREAAAALARRGDAANSIWVLYRLSSLLARRRDWDAARPPLDEALRLAARPEGDPRVRFHLELARAQALDRGGHFPAAVTAFRGAIELRRKLVAGSLAVAVCLNGLAGGSMQIGDLAAAEEALLEALTIERSQVPGTLAEASQMTNLGIVRMRRGDLAAAEDLFRRALAMDQALVPGTMYIAADFTNLANLAIRRGDPLGGADFERQALEIRQLLAPDSPEVVQSLQGIASALLADDPAAAEDTYRRCLAIQERIHDRADFVAHSHAGIAEAMWAARRDPAAEGHLRQALTLQETVAPRSQDYAEMLDDLTVVLLGLGRPLEAEDAGRRALALVRQVVPGTALQALVGHDLAAVERRLGRSAEARELGRQALATLESQAGRLGGSEQARSNFSAKYAGYYRDHLDLLVELGAEAEAWNVLERYRARGFLDLLAERDLTFASDLPAGLERERRLANAEYDRALARLAEAQEGPGPGSAPPPETTATLERQLQEARRRQEDVEARIRAASPRLAALRYPEPLDLAATRRALDPGTLLLSYSIGEEESYLFAIGPDAASFHVLRLRVTEAALRDEVRRFRTSIEQSRGAADRAVMLRLAAPLTAWLLAPVAPQIARAQRLLILPDGPLHFLPFAALADPGTAAPAGFLIEALPIHVAASATVYAELRKRRRPRSEARLVAFGDPLYPAPPAGASPEAARGPRLEPLPGTRAEIESLRALFPGRARIFVGAEATEERVKAVGKDASILHLACHGLIDERFPLESALALTIPERQREGQDNGLLQAWEIFEQVRLDADLVTLSACRSALGKELEGEGLMGLSRAFQFAGARSVLASLWQIGDASTSELMRRFYGYLQGGKAKDEALRLAQLDLLRGPIEVPAGTSRTRLDASHPFSWAAFELLGDRQ